MAPTGLEIDMSLSLSTTKRSVPEVPAWFSASKAMPAERDASPITATTRRLSPWIRAACAMPKAAPIEVLECPAPKLS
jgi:hypothetical protein